MYTHATECGAIRMGSGSKARFGFDRAGIENGSATTSSRHEDARASPKPGSDNGSRQRDPSTVSAHLQSAARVLEQILGELDPQYDWVVRVRETELTDGQRDSTASVRGDESRAVLDNPNALGKRDTLAPTGRCDDYALDEAA